MLTGSPPSGEQNNVSPHVEFGFGLYHLGVFGFEYYSTRAWKLEEAINHNTSLVNGGGCPLLIYEWWSNHLWTRGSPALGVCFFRLHQLAYAVSRDIAATWNRRGAEVRLCLPEG